MTSEAGIVLCRLDDIALPGAKGFVIGDAAPRRRLFVVRDQRGIHAYENACPHSLGPLEWSPGQFLSADGTHIQCAMHGSLFRIDDGLCIQGPCVGESLTPAVVTLCGGDVVLAA